ncbi:hypothetical protein OAE93_01790 [bacterium]|nr:hypothetical protein [bacterium]
MKYLFTILLVAISVTSFAQGNLQFNQVLNFDYSAIVPAYGDVSVGTLTVPPDKVWKITAASSSGDVLTSRDKTMIVVNNHTISAARSNGISNNTPYWLSSGTSNQIKFANLYSSGRDIVGSISVLEFNVVP